MNRGWLSLTCVVTGVAAGLIVTGIGAMLALRRRDVGTVARLCADLEREDGGEAERFDPSMVDHLPVTVRRYFLHAIRSGTPLARAVRLEMAGQMRLGADQDWMPFRAQQVLALPAGFVWDASIGTSLQHFAGADTYGHGRGHVTFRLWDLLPIRRASDPNISRAARGRLAIEAIWQPASLLPQRGVTWTSTDDQTAQATVVIDGEAIPLTLVIGPDGSLRSVRIERWGNLTADAHFALIPFGADISGESSFGGYTVPSQLRVVWWYGTDQSFDFFHVEVGQATFLPCGDPR
jgi:hypothetical protein